MKFTGTHISGDRREDWSFEAMSVGELIDALSEYPRDDLVQAWYGSGLIHGIKEYMSADDMNEIRRPLGAYDTSTHGIVWLDNID